MDDITADPSHHRTAEFPVQASGAVSHYPVSGLSQGSPAPHELQPADKVRKRLPQYCHHPQPYGAASIGYLPQQESDAGGRYKPE